MFKSYVNNEQFNLQINRFINDYYQEDDRAQADLEKIIPKLTTPIAGMKLGSILQRNAKTARTMT
ncbi:hypothetical protein D3C74_257220 [compost metagenome]